MWAVIVSEDLSLQNSHKQHLSFSDYICMVDADFTLFLRLPFETKYLLLNRVLQIYKSQVQE
jgi:hypothetical protein